MPKTNRRKRHRILALIAAGAMALVVVLIVAIVIVVLRRPEAPQTALPPTAVPPTAVPPTTGKKPRPEFQDASCPDVQMISIPGTWESSPTAGSRAPTQFPASLMSKGTTPLPAQCARPVVSWSLTPVRAQLGAGRLVSFPVPCTAHVRLLHDPGTSSSCN